MQAALVALLLSLVWGMLAAQPLAEDGQDLSVIPLDIGKDKLSSSTTNQPEISREERHRQIDEYLRSHRRELGDVVDTWFNSRWSGNRWAGID